MSNSELPLMGKRQAPFDPRGAADNKAFSRPDRRSGLQKASVSSFCQPQHPVHLETHWGDMACITLELIRKRSEHHSGCLYDLEELSLAQQHLDRIELLGRVCPHLRILTLQANSIPRLENLSRMKDLRYLNVAINQICRVENLQGCESLEKLDLTLNRIGVADLPSIGSLRANVLLRRMYLLGNPCASWPGHREYVIAVLPQLQHLDGKDVLRSERIRATQQLPALKQYIDGQHTAGVDESEGLAESLKQAHGQVECVAELGPPDGETIVEVNQTGLPRQRNQGKWPFRLEETKHACTVTVTIGKYTRLENIDIDVQSSYVQILFKAQAFVLHLPANVNISASRAEHSMHSGELIVHMPKADAIMTTSLGKLPRNATNAASLRRLRSNDTSETYHKDEVHMETRLDLPELTQ